MTQDIELDFQPKAPLQLITSRLQELIVSVDADWPIRLTKDAVAVEGDSDVRVGVGFGRRCSEDHVILISRLILDFKGKRKKKKPRRFKRIKIALEGIFSFPLETLAQLEQPVAHDLLLNTLIILYGICRGIILGCTGACPGGPHTIPALYLEGFLKDHIQRYGGPEAWEPWLRQGTPLERADLPADSPA